MFQSKIPTFFKKFQEKIDTILGWNFGHSSKHADRKERKFFKHGGDHEQRLNRNKNAIGGNSKNQNQEKGRKKLEIFRFQADE
jgi:hypothetical protein